MHCCRQLSQHDSEIVALAAYVHDLGDYKYADEEQHLGHNVVQNVLADAGVSTADCVDVLYVIDNMSYSTELSGQGLSGTPRQNQLLAVVRDADRLDAIGAIGIARCLTYGGAKKRVLYDPAVPPRLHMSSEEYKRSATTGAVAGGSASDSSAPVPQATTINHFYEKLLKLKDLMLTEPGKRMAVRRHECMESFLEQFQAEVQGLR